MRERHVEVARTAAAAARTAAAAARTAAAAARTAAARSVVAARNHVVVALWPDVETGIFCCCAFPIRIPALVHPIVPRMVG